MRDVAGLSVMDPPNTPRILAATGLETWALRRALPGTRITRIGMRLRGWHEPPGGIALVCGVAGALSPALAPGTVVVPHEVGLPDGSRLPCDSLWSERLAGAASSLGHPVDRGPLLTAPSIITGPARDVWSREGFVAADMEAGWLLAQGWHVATVRVVLDTPARSISADWERPLAAARHPGLWGEMAWMAWHAPRFALRAASVVRRALAEA